MRSYIHSQEESSTPGDALRHKPAFYTLPVFLGILYTNLTTLVGYRHGFRKKRRSQQQQQLLPTLVPNTPKKGKNQYLESLTVLMGISSTTQSDLYHVISADHHGTFCVAFASGTLGFKLFCSLHNLLVRFVLYPTTQERSVFYCCCCFWFYFFF